MRRVNLFRWLLGLNDGVLTGSAATVKQAQDAAKMMDANNQLSHSPPASWTCYTAEGAAGAGSGNLALGYSSAASTVDGYMQDSGTPSLGHRRWIISSGLGCTTFGHYNRGGCQKVFSFSGSTCDAPTGTATAFVAFPPPGDAPQSSIRGVWSFARTSGSIAGATVTIQNTATCANVPVTVSELQNGYGNPTISFGNPSYTLNQPLEIKVAFADSTSYTYTTRIVDCAASCPGAIPSNTCGQTTTGPLVSRPLVSRRLVSRPLVSQRLEFRLE
jgi:Cysteine-rich secretory protein family